MTLHLFILLGILILTILVMQYLQKNGSAARPGDMLCRLGFSFPEFTDFNYDLVNDQIEWDPSGNSFGPDVLCIAV